MCDILGAKNEFYDNQAFIDDPSETSNRFYRVQVRRLP